jgi:hypothetical protein
MRSHAISLVAAGALLALPATAQTLDEVLARHLQARGGAERIAATRALRATGTMTFGDGKAPFTMEWKAPNLLRIEVVVRGETGVQAFDGTTGWMHLPFAGMPAPEVMPAEAVAQVAEQADFHGPLVDAEAKGHKVALVGRRGVGGAEAYELRITLRGGGVVTEYLDAASFLTVKQVRTLRRGDQEAVLETSLGDYRESGGLMLPHTLETRVEGAPEGVPVQAIAVETYDLAPEIDDGRFLMPGKPAAGAARPR